MAMNQVKSDPLSKATILNKITMNDPRWLASDGWVKMQYIVEHLDKSVTTIHFLYNVIA